MLTDPQRWPAVVFVCAHTGFVCARFLPSQRPEAYINVLSCNWATLLGFPRILICDNATTFCGPRWGASTHVYDVNLILAPTKAAYQIGVAERAVGLLKNGFHAISRFEEGRMSKELKLSLTCIARNSTPLSGSELSPLMLTTGRDDIAGKSATASRNRSWIADEYSPMASHFRRLTAVAFIRAEMIAWDARNMAQLALSKNIRKGPRKYSRVKNLFRCGTTSCLYGKTASAPCSILEEISSQKKEED